MAMAHKLFIALCLFFPASRIIAFLNEVVKDDKLEVTASPNVLDTSLDLTLKVTCRFRPLDHTEVTRLLTLTLAKRKLYVSEARDLVTVTEQGLHDADDFLGIGQGYVSNDGKDSMIEIEITHPTSNDLGEYQCQTVTLDTNGNLVKSEKSLVVNDLTECMNAQDKSSMETIRRNFMNCGASEETWFQYLRNMTAKKYEVSDDSDSSEVYGVTDMFNSSSFYIISINNIPFDKGEQLCKENNGYLAEINTEDEFVFINQSVALFRENNFQPFYYLVTGASFEFPNRKFEFDTHPGAPMYLGQWDEGEPRYYPSSNRLVLYDKKHYGHLKMADSHGIQDLWNSFLCEVSKDV